MIRPRALRGDPEIGFGNREMDSAGLDFSYLDVVCINHIRIGFRPHFSALLAHWAESREKFCSASFIRTSRAWNPSEKGYGYQGTLASPNQVAGSCFRKITPDAETKVGRNCKNRKATLCHTNFRELFSKIFLRLKPCRHNSYL